MLALARKYRPKNFASVAVQSHVSNTLKGAIARNRVASGYLLCGPRGTGKTTLARVLAMALNCERLAEARHQSGPGQASGAGASEGEPCGECASCQRIWSGSASLDVVEIDAASNRGVDDARDLRERAMYAPSGDDRYKVYIVDEAHMLTREAWNALLKILEEPPPRVVFVFCTTEPQKIAQAAAPILSRLQRFDLKRIGPAEIRERLAAVLDAEGVRYEPEALGMLSRAADGGLRDALSLTDQVLSIGAEGAVTADRVREALGVVPEDEYLAILDLVAGRRAGDVFGAVARLADMGVDFGAFITGLGDALRAQLAVTLGGRTPDLSERMRAELERRREALAPGDLLRMLHALTELEPRFRKSAQQQLLLETLLVRFALLDRAVLLEDVLRGLSGAGTGGNGGGAGPGGVGSGGGGGRALGGTGGAGPASFASRPPAASQGGAPPSATMPAQSISATSVGGPARATLTGAPASSAGGAARATAAAPALAAEPAPPPAARTGRPPDLNVVAERWGEVVAAVRQAGKGVLATALESAAPAAISGQGALLVEFEEPNDIYERAFESAKDELLVALRSLFGGGIGRVALKRSDRGAPAPRERLTSESVKAERLALLRKKDPVLSAAVDALDLELLD
ncbi:MAG: DNA polymerase III subunit gamma/tau [Gemmatimonadaceae bacterium]